MTLLTKLIKQMVNQDQHEGKEEWKVQVSEGSSRHAPPIFLAMDGFVYERGIIVNSIFKMFSQENVFLQIPA